MAMAQCDISLLKTEKKKKMCLIYKQKYPWYNIVGFSRATSSLFVLKISY